jgi:transformation/transcription domain-associated protein
MADAQYMVKMMSTPESLWLMRKQFAVEMSTLSFLTYFSCLTNRAPPRFHLSRKTGHIYMSEILLGE